MRDYCFTINNYTDEMISALSSLATEGKCKYIMWGHEIGESGTKHLQGYVEFPRDRQIITIKKLPGFKTAHLEARKGTQQQAIDYCKKDGNFVEFGEKKSPGARSDLKHIVDQLKAGEITLDEIVLDHPAIYQQYHKTLEKAMDVINRSRKRDGNMPECIWLYGDTGSGKSHKAFTENPDSATD